MSLLAMAVAGAGLLLAHDLPDQTVDRGIQLIIRKNRIDVDYELDMNLKMVAETLRQSDRLPAGWKDSDLESPRAADLLPLIRELMLNRLGKQMKLSINGELQTLEAVRVTPAAVHTALLRATYRASFVSRKADVVLEFADTNFASFDGWRRIAAKARPPASISESSTKPILIRIPRDLSKPLPAKQLRTIQAAKVIFHIPQEAVAKQDAKAPSTSDSVRQQPSVLPSQQPQTQKSAPLTTSPQVPQRPHIGWFALAFILMTLLSFICYLRSPPQAPVA